MEKSWKIIVEKEWSPWIQPSQCRASCPDTASCSVKNCSLFHVFNGNCGWMETKRKLGTVPVLL